MRILHGRNIVALGTLACVLSACPSAFALNPALDISQYVHTSWKIRDGFAKGTIKSIAQTPDGYLWLATDFGLLRFDGVRAVPWRPPEDQQLPSNDIWSVLAARDGALWIGTAKGLARWKGGALTQYPELAGRFVARLLEDHEGTVWAGGIAVPTGRLCAIRAAGVACDGDDGIFGFGPFGLYEDRKGALWVGMSGGLWRWHRGPRAFFPIADGGDNIQGFTEDRDGALLFTTRQGIRRVVGGTTEPYRISESGLQLQGYRLMRDRDGALWVGTLPGGLLRAYQGRIDVFAQADGLSGDAIAALLEDREGNVWVATDDGLDRFRNVAVSTLSAKQGLSNSMYAVAASRDGSVWLTSLNGVARWADGQVIVYRDRAGHSTAPNVSELVVTGLPDGDAGALFQDNHQRVWLAFANAVGYLADDRFVAVPGIATPGVRAIAQDSRANLWIAHQQVGLFRISPSGVAVEQIPWSVFGHQGFATALSADPKRGGLWLGFWDGGIVYFEDGKIAAAYGPERGLGSGTVRGFRSETDGTLWVATEGGLSRLSGGRVDTLTSKSGLPCDSIYWVMEDDLDSLWLKTACGLVRVSGGDLDAWAADRRRLVKTTVFDSLDGVRSAATPNGFSPYVTKDTIGRLWFVGVDGVKVLDPRHLPFNKLPPPVHIEQITADRKTYDVTLQVNRRLRLPALIRDLEIDYTALSLVVPEKVQFRYKLEGFDRDWQDVGNRRQAFYNNLPPRSYRFRVIASNNSGVWNEAGAFLDFSVAPAYYQTTWFRVSLVAAVLTLVGALYQLRLRQVARQFNVRLEERVNERTRIARDLHDTLLQSFHGVLLRFQAAALLLPDRPAEARETLDTAIDSAGQALVEGRDAVLGLRPQTIANNDLAAVMRTLGEELSASDQAQPPPDFRVRVEGTPRDLAPLVRDEVYRIAREALRNAFQHAHATEIEVEIRYEPRRFQLRVRDDGKGIEAAVFADGGRAGHYGLAGMRERTELLGGTLGVWSKPDAGTEVELTLPGSVAYGKTSKARRSTFFGDQTL